MIDRTTLFAFVYMVLQTAVPCSIEAQHIVDAAIGSKVRVQSEESTRWKIGRLAGVAPDTIQLRQCDSCQISTYVLPSLKAIEVSMGRTQRLGTVLGLGLLGAAVGAAAGDLYARHEVDNCPPGNDLCGLAYLAVPVFGAGGLIIGLIGGSMKFYDDWRPAPIR